MNAFKTLSSATFAIAAVAVVAAAAPAPTNASILETLDRLEERGTSSKSGAGRSVFSSESSQDVETSSSEDSVQDKNFRPDFLQKVEANSTGSESGVYNKNVRPDFLQKLNDASTSSESGAY